jgi:uncharacterized membrane protein YkoI
MKKSLVIAFFLASLSTAAFAADTTTAPATSSSATTTAPAADSNATTTTTSTDTTTAKAPKAISVSNLLQQLTKAGYVVHEVDFDKDNGKFKVDATDRYGDKQSLDVDGSGLTADQRKVPHTLSIAQAAKKVEKNGAYIKSISYDSGNYKATVVDKQGNSTDVAIDAKTGKVSNS